jgi:predicted MFS family arabinose efflux permease
LHARRAAPPRASRAPCAALRLASALASISAAQTASAPLAPADLATSIVADAVTPSPHNIGSTARQAVTVFAVFAFAYYFSALLRAVTATLAPVFSAELGLSAGDLGLLAGAYFFGFAAMQLPLGRALDGFGPRRTLLALLAVAVLGCIAFALAAGVAGLIAARALIGVGVAACLMAPLTCYRRLYSQAALLRANSWMLMTGSLGMLASTLPVQWLLPVLGWRGLFWALAAALAACMVGIALGVPRDPAHDAVRRAAAEVRYADIVRHSLFVRTAPLGFFVYGGLIAVQALWAGPWLTRVAGQSALEAAGGLFAINLAMLVTFFAWGALMPRLARRGISAAALMTWGLPLPLALLALIVVLGPQAGAVHWALWCVACTFVSVSQPAVGAAFPAEQAGRALSAFNLVIFGGVFCIQWGIGLAIDALRAAGMAELAAFRIAFALFGAAGAAAYVWFLWRGRGAGGAAADNASSTA